jgi:hypothetical protein
MKIDYSRVNTSTKGALKELVVTIDLLARGYDVFRAINPSCSCDLVATKGKSFIRIEVTTARKYKEKITYPPHNSLNYDLLAAVFDDTSIVYIPDLLS